MLLQCLLSYLLLWGHPQLQAGLGEGFRFNRSDWPVLLLVCARGPLQALLLSVHVSPGLM